MKPSLPLTSITRQLKEVGETRDEVDDGPQLPSSPVSYTNTGLYTLKLPAFYQLRVFFFLGTLTRRHSRRKSSNNSTDDSSNSGGTLKRQTSYKTRGSLESMGGRSGSSTPLCGTPNRERASPFGGDRELQMLGEREKSSPFGGDRPPSVGSVRSPLTTNNSNMDNMPSCMVCSFCLNIN